MGRKRKRDKHLPSGVTREHGAYYFRGRDRKRTRLGTTLQEALAKWSELMEPQPGSIRTMHDAFERYKLEVLPKRAPKTQRNQSYMFPVVDEVFGAMAPQEVRARHGYAFLAKRSPQAQTSALKEFNLVSAVLTKCVEWGVIDENPLWQVRKAEYTPAPRTSCPTDDEFAAVYGIANERMQIAMDIALLTGLRRVGIIALTLDADTTDGLLAVQPGKKTKALLFTWTPELRAVIDRARRLEPRVRRALLCTGKGTHYSADGFSAIWQRLTTKAVKGKLIARKFSFNDIRAKSATDSATVAEASSRLGHTTEAMTRRVYIRKPSKVTPLR